MLRIALALAVLAAQMAPALHGFHEDKDLTSHCRDGSNALHFCACNVDHDHPSCTLCRSNAGSWVADVAPLGEIEQCDLPDAAAPAAVPLEYSASPDAPRGPPAVS